jgi:S1-C subfamily serine protease
VDLAGHHGRLSLLEPAAGDGSDPARSSSPPAAELPWARRLNKLDEQNYEVDRDLVRELVTGVTKAGGVRFMPVLDHGEVRGVRLLGVTATTIPFALGLRSGDTLTAIDGAPLQNLQQLLDLYARLDQLTAVELSGTRAAKPISRTLRLR